MSFSSTLRPIGHASLHLNLRPQFGVLDALQNLHRLDVSLLDGLMTPTKEGLHLLAGPQQPYPTEPTPGELARLFDLLVNHYRFVVVDASSRLDPTTRLLSDLSNAVLVVAQTDVVSLWSAGRIHAFLEEGTGRDRLRMVLNRYKKIPGFTEEDVEQVTNCKVLWKVPNAFQAVSPSIDHGTPVVLQEGPEISRSYRALAAALAEASSNSDGSPDLVYGDGGRPQESSRPPESVSRSAQDNNPVLAALATSSAAGAGVASCGNILNTTSRECDVTFLFTSLAFSVSVPLSTK